LAQNGGSFKFHESALKGFGKKKKNVLFIYDTKIQKYHLSKF